MPSLHQRRRHPQPIEGCFGCRVSTVRIGLSEQVRDIDSREKTLRKDLDAYKDFRRSGLQPRSMTGSARLAETARTPLEVEHPTLMKLPEEFRKHAGEAAQIVTDIQPGLSRFADG